MDPFAPCNPSPDNAACDAALNASDNEFWLSGLPAGYLHTGLFGRWNSSSRVPAYVVTAASASDISSTVAFASKYNVRLVVKNTGHDWFTRSSAPGSLLLWTHNLKSMTFGNYSGCGGGGGGSGGIPAVTIGAGVQFADLYPAAQERGLVVVGGTCDSVGAVGCWLGGCYGTFSKLYGSGAANLLSATVVLASGDVVVASECENADLFWSLRGGGGGLAGVVVDMTARTHAAPRWMLLAGGGYFATDDAGWQQLLEMQLNYTRLVMSPPWGGGVGWSAASGGGGGGVSFWAKGFEVAAAAGAALVAPFDALVAAQPARFSGRVKWTTWNASAWQPGDALPWMEAHPDREISTSLLASFSRYPVAQQWADGAAAAALARAIAGFTREMPTGVRGIAGGIDFEKGALGAAPDAAARAARTSVNPVTANASGLLLIMYNVPALPSVPDSAALLRRLWPRLENYLALAPTDPLLPLCAAGAAGDDAAAVQCLALWRAQRAPALQAGLAQARDAMLDAFPSLDGAGQPFSGAYIHETDYDDADWARSQWGDDTYAKLSSVKIKYDQKGLFTCHHCVGSEKWNNDGNCRA